MKTIDERAMQYAYRDGEIVDAYYNNYINIATEQRDIDIEKAIKAHCSLCTFKKCCEESKEHNCFEIEEIKKAMMEE